jgi:hypothetical protein
MARYALNLGVIHFNIVHEAILTSILHHVCHDTEVVVLIEDGPGSHTNSAKEL